VSTEEVKQRVHKALTALEQAPDDIRELEAQIAGLLLPDAKRHADSAFRALVQRVPEREPESFVAAKRALIEAMKSVARVLSHMWDDDRYTRAGFDFGE